MSERGGSYRADADAQLAWGRANRDYMVQELADVLVVLRGIADLNDLPWASVEQAATVERAQRGGFAARLFLES